MSRIARDDRALDLFEPEHDNRKVPPGILAALMLLGALVAIVVFHASVIAIF